VKIVIDTNIIFSLLINKNLKLLDTFTAEKYQFYMPTYAVIELFNHKEKIVKYTKLTKEEVTEFLYRILSRITIINDTTISEKAIKQAYNLVREVDIKDLPFVALAIELNAYLWTGDKKLQEHLKIRGFERFFYKSGIEARN